RGAARSSLDQSPTPARPLPTTRDRPRSKTSFSAPPKGPPPPYRPRSPETRHDDEPMTSRFLSISPRITVLPVIHGSGDCALEVRRVMLEQKFDCLAVPLPPSFQRDVERAIEHLPAITVVTQAEPNQYLSTDWNPDRDSAGE